jgi:hypothetical protein
VDDECLHCKISRTITEHFEAQPRDNHGKVRVDVREVMEKLMEVGGEILNLVPEDMRRDAFSYSCSALAAFTFEEAGLDGTIEVDKYRDIARPQ